MIYRSKPMLAAVERARLLARGRVAVTLLGPSGAGKSTLARSIHEWSGREGKLITINGADLAGDMGRGRLWGWSRGAFSGATRAQSGAFEDADGGTLFLDEVGDMPLDQQAGILRALSQGVVARLGETTERQVNVRIIAATALDLDELVASGRFRRDLACRLSAVGRVLVPGLDERREDVWPIAQAMASGWCSLDASARPVLEAHVWSEGLHELRAVIDTAGEGDTLTGERVAQILSPLAIMTPAEVAASLSQPFRASDLAAALGVSPRTAGNRLSELIEAGVVSVTGAARSTRYRCETIAHAA